MVVEYESGNFGSGQADVGGVDSEDDVDDAVDIGENACDIRVDGNSNPRPKPARVILAADELERERIWPWVGVWDWDVEPVAGTVVAVEVDLACVDLYEPDKERECGECE